MGDAVHKVNLSEAFASFHDVWSPKIAGEINDSHVKLVKLAGAFDWRHHDVEDEFFLVVAGRMRMGLRPGISTSTRASSSSSRMASSTGRRR